ncbi:MAG: FecR family protein, partial [Nannocystaceae bacterium]|nr:FecR family protein [Nannocystaceae bacterium]
LVAGLAGWAATRAPQDEAPAELAALTSAPEELAAPLEPPPSIPVAPAPALALLDGSIATLHDGARLELRAQTQAEIRIEQLSGRVHYEVRPGLPRRFVVEAGTVDVTVVGTAFWVTHEPDAVRVTVEHGRVRVARDGETTAAMLGAGDELRLESSATTATTTEIARVEPVRSGGRSRSKLRAPTLPEPVATASIDTLLQQADEAMLRGDRAAAAEALRAVLRDFGDDPRAYGSAFQLGKLERARGRHRAAAQAFLTAARKSPLGALTEDARADAAIELSEAGDAAAAREAGEDYLAQYPSGAHRSRIERMLAQLR